MCSPSFISHILAGLGEVEHGPRVIGVLRQLRKQHLPVPRHPLEALVSVQGTVLVRSDLQGPFNQGDAEGKEADLILGPEGW